MTRVKICGVTNPGDAMAAVELGAWAVGLIFHPDSPRACDPPTGEEVGGMLRRRCEVAGVFVNATLDEVAELAERCSLTLLQLHGDEGPSFCDEAARRTGCKVMKAARVRDAASVRALRPYRVDYHLLDAYVAGRPGGTGTTFMWELAERSGERSVPMVLSGGLDADNVGEAIRVTQPFAVDVASGTESVPGRKDHARLRAFMRAVEAADARAAA